MGWAQAIRYHAETLGDKRYQGSIAVAHGGEASTAANGFWAALNIATTLRLPMLFYIEDNGYGISVRSALQTPGSNIARNLSGFANLRIYDGDGSDPVAAAKLIADAVSAARCGEGPALLRLLVPRLSGHSGQDTQTYKAAQELSAEPSPFSRALAAAMSHASSSVDCRFKGSDSRSSLPDSILEKSRISLITPKSWSLDTRMVCT